MVDTSRNIKQTSHSILLLSTQQWWVGLPGGLKKKLCLNGKKCLNTCVMHANCILPGKLRLSRCALSYQIWLKLYSGIKSKTAVINFSFPSVTVPGEWAVCVQPDPGPSAGRDGGNSPTPCPLPPPLLALDICVSCVVTMSRRSGTGTTAMHFSPWNSQSTTSMGFAISFSLFVFFFLLSRMEVVQFRLCES